MCCHVNCQKKNYQGGLEYLVFHKIFPHLFMQKIVLSRKFTQPFSVDRSGRGQMGMIFFIGAIATL